jgi:hypothetical protein
VQHDRIELVHREQPVPADRGVGGADGLEGAVEIAREDEVYDVLRDERALRRDRVHDRDRALERRRLDPDLLPQLAIERIDDRLARVDAAAGQEPDVLALLLVPAEEHPVPPA